MYPKTFGKMTHPRVPLPTKTQKLSFGLKTRRRARANVNGCAKTIDLSQETLLGYTLYLFNIPPLAFWRHFLLQTGFLFKKPHLCVCICMDKARSTYPRGFFPSCIVLQATFIRFSQEWVVLGLVRALKIGMPLLRLVSFKFLIF